MARNSSPGSRSSIRSISPSSVCPPALQELADGLDWPELEPDLVEGIRCGILFREKNKGPVCFRDGDGCIEHLVEVAVDGCQEFRVDHKDFLQNLTPLPPLCQGRKGGWGSLVGFSEGKRTFQRPPDPLRPRSLSMCAPSSRKPMSVFPSMSPFFFRSLCICSNPGRSGFLPYRNRGRWQFHAAALSRFPPYEAPCCPRRKARRKTGRFGKTSGCHQTKRNEISPPIEDPMTAVFRRSGFVRYMNRSSA